MAGTRRRLSCNITCALDGPWQRGCMKLMVAVRLSHGLAAAVLLCFAPSALPQSTATNALNVVRLSGSAHEQGLPHGRRLQREIRELVALWKADLKLNFGAEPDAFIAAFLEVSSDRELIGQG